MPASKAPSSERVRAWFDLPKPAHVRVSQAEWDWYCYRTRHSRQQREKPAPKPAITGATAGWRSGFF